MPFSGGEHPGRRSRDASSASGGPVRPFPAADLSHPAIPLIVLRACRGGFFGAECIGFPAAADGLSGGQAVLPCILPFPEKDHLKIPSPYGERKGDFYVSFLELRMFNPYSHTDECMSRQMSILLFRSGKVTAIPSGAFCLCPAPAWPDTDSCRYLSFFKNADLTREKKASAFPGSGPFPFRPLCPAPLPPARGTAKKKGKSLFSLF